MVTEAQAINPLKMDKSSQLLITQMMLWTTQKNPVDVIISDVNMPDKTGLETIRKSYFQIPIISAVWLSEFEYVVSFHEPFSVAGLFGRRQGGVGQFIRKDCAATSERWSKVRPSVKKLMRQGFTNYRQVKTAGGLNHP